MIWKEPLLARKQSFKESPYFHPKTLLKSGVGCIVLSTVESIFLWNISPHRVSREVAFNLFLAFTFMLLLLLTVTVGGFWLASCFAATYRIDEKGFKSRRFGCERFVPWRRITHLEIAPHATLTNIFLIKIIWRTLKPLTVQMPLRTQRILNTLIKLNWPDFKVQFPFEEGQIETAEVLELFQKYAQK